MRSSISKLLLSKRCLYLLVCLVVVECLPGARSAQAANVPLTKTALRELNDGMGWKKAQYYKTIQPVDLDGDGQSELLARWIDGLHIYRFSSGALVYHSFIPAFADNSGFTDPSWYETIHAAVLDPKSGMADIVVREADGIHVFRFDAKQRLWGELGQGVIRPFANNAADGTDWSRPEYYRTIRLADLNRDGSAELIGRGKNGLTVYTWDNSSDSWQPLSMAGELADSDGYERPSSYETIQLIDVDGDGIPELIVRSPRGVRTLRWTGAGFTLVTNGGPFSDVDGSAHAGRYRSIHTLRDANGQAWLYGFGLAKDSAQQNAIRIFRWKDDNWRSVLTIPLRDEGRNEKSESSVLLGANLVGDPSPEFLVRTSTGLVGYSAQGQRLKDRIRGFSDANGWNLERQSSTLTTATIHTDSGSQVPVVLGRGRDGLQALKFDNGWQQAADSQFPDFCKDGANSPSCIAYGCLSLIGAGVVLGVPITDIRSQYGVNSLEQGFWQVASGNMFRATQPTGRGACTTVPVRTWQMVEDQLVYETSYVAVVAGWFYNNVQVLSMSFGASGNLLNEVIGNLNNIDNGTQVNTEWTGLGLDIAAGLARFLPGPAGAGLSFVITVLKDAIDLSAPSDPTAAITGLYNDLDNQQSNSVTQNSNQREAYATDYGMLQQIGSQQTDWANANSPEVTQAIIGAKSGFRIHFYKVIAPYKWQVAWCSQSFDFRAVPCIPVDTPPTYYCQYGTPSPYYGNSTYHSNAYLTTGYYGPPLAWSAVDLLTGTSSSDLNAIWYPMMLGGNLGWDFQAYINANGSYSPQTESEFTYGILEHGYNGPSSDCLGNGSTTGIQPGTQDPGQSLTIAQANTQSYGPDYVHHLDAELAELQDEVRADATVDEQTRTRLSQILEQAKDLLNRVFQGPSGTISATTPTLLMEWFVGQVESSGCSEAGRMSLTSHAYALLADLEGPGAETSAISGEE